MNIRNKVTSELSTITTYDPSTGEITGLIPIGTSNLGSNSNVTITGGTDGQVLTTDGAGNLSWTTPSGFATELVNGNSNVVVNANSTVVMGSNGVAGVLTVDQNGITVSSNSNAQSFYTTAANGLVISANSISSLGDITIDPLDDGTPLGNVTVLGNVFVTGTLSYNSISNSVTDNLVWIAANASVPASAADGAGLAVGPDGAYASFTYSNAANSWVSSLTLTSGNGVNVNGSLSGATTGAFSGQVTAASFTGDGGNLSNIAAANVVGPVAAANVAASANTVAGANVTGFVVFANTANIVAGGNVSGPVAYATIANTVAGANVGGEVAFAAVANSVAGANVSGQVSNALVAGTVYTNAQPNITSVGTLTSLTSSGNITANPGAYFVGDGGYLSNLQVSSGIEIVNGTSNVSIPLANGNINFVTNGVQTATIDTTGNLTANGMVIANGSTGGNSIGFLSKAAASNVMLGTTSANMAIRDWTNGQSTMWFDVGVGGSTPGVFQWRTTSGYASMMLLSGSGVVVTGAIQNSGNTINMSASGTATAGYLVSTGAIQAQSTIQTPQTIGNFGPAFRYAPANSATGTQVSMDNLNCRFNNGGGSTLQPAISAVSGSFGCYITGYLNKSGAAITGYTNSGGVNITAGTWTTIPGTNTSFGAGGDMLTSFLTDNTNNRTYRITWIHGQANQAGSITIERIG